MGILPCQMTDITSLQAAISSMPLPAILLFRISDSYTTKKAAHNLARTLFIKSQYCSHLRTHPNAEIDFNELWIRPSLLAKKSNVMCNSDLNGAMEVPGSHWTHFFKVK